ncbi:alpha-amylase family glycosyl hydrolase [Gracilinema caldarium]|uniref:alpha-amylase family glycosyl hydrolase n=1 Tax=Gracilinema caldarium TaxID=215591 RepID=UPI0026ECD9EA|nr:alpha-amylase family glycosyl hydrolase [Gracilinema caldarium]
MSFLIVILCSLVLTWIQPAPLAAQDVPWWKDAAGPAYQVLVYSFADSDGNGYGDIRGLTQALDYLNDGNPETHSDLNISAIWLSPVNPASSYHGYDVKDYRAIDPKLGTMEDFDTLVREAHKRGIKIIMDMVFNHTSREHPWFLEAMKSASSPYVNYYRTKQNGVSYGASGMGRFYKYTRPDGSVFEYFSAFWEGMPDLNLDNTDVVNELKDVLAFWMNRGVDGFRFDAAKHAFDPNEMPSGTPTLALNKTFWNDLRRASRRVKPDVYFIGEVLTENLAEVTAYTGVFDGLFDFPAARQVIDAVRRMSGTGFIQAYQNMYGQYKRIPAFQSAPLLSNHDQDRYISSLLTSMSLDAVKGLQVEPADTDVVRTTKALALAKAKMAASIYQTLPGLPYIYYGEELGMTGRRYKNDDVARRDAFKWNDTGALPMVNWMQKSGKIEPGQNSLTPSVQSQLKDPASLLRHYLGLAELRQYSPALRQGNFVVPEWAGFNTGYLLGWIRESDSQKVLVLHNLDSISFTAAVPEQVQLVPLWNSAQGYLDVKNRKILKSGDTLKLEAAQSAVYEIQNP